MSEGITVRDQTLYKRIPPTKLSPVLYFGDWRSKGSSSQATSVIDTRHSLLPLRIDREITSLSQLVAFSTRLGWGFNRPGPGRKRPEAVDRSTTPSSAGGPPYGIGALDAFERRTGRSQAFDNAADASGIEQESGRRRYQLQELPPTSDDL